MVAVRVYMYFIDYLSHKVAAAGPRRIHYSRGADSGQWKSMGSSGDRGPCRLHAHSTAHCGAASLAFIGPNHACRSHCQVLSPNNNTPVKTGVLWGCIEGVGDGLNG